MVPGEESRLDRIGIKAKQSFYIASPRAGNLIQQVGRYKGQPTVFARDLEQLEAAGYRRVGDYMVHPGELDDFVIPGG